MSKSMLSKLGFAFALGLFACQTSAISLDLNSISASAPSSRGSIKFNGATDTFYFDNVTAAGPTLGYSFTLSGSDGAGDSFGDLGKIDGVFKIGAITATGTKQSAPVTLLSGTGLLTIADGNGFFLKGTVKWIDIFTDGTTGGINAGGAINLLGVTYSGLEQDLLALRGDASASINFGFNPGKSLTALVAGTSVKVTTFSGDISRAEVPDGASTLVLLGGSLLCLAPLRRKIVR